MADTLPEHKEGGDDGKPSTVVPLREESSGLQCASSGICSGDPHPKEASTLLHSSALQQGECGSVSLHPAEAKGAKSSEEAADNPGRLVVKDGSEAAEAFKKQDDEISLGFDESKLAKTSVSQAKDPPERENSQAERKMLVTEKNESPPLEGASSEIQSVSTKSSETPEALNDNSSGHPQPCAPALAETVLTGDVLKKPGIPTGIGTSSAVGCQESLMSSPKPTSPSTKKSPDLGLESSSSVSRDPHQERSVETLAESQGPSKNSIGLASLEAAGIEVSSTRLSTISSATDLCSASQLEHSVVDSPSQSSLATSGSESSSTPTQTSSVQQQESGNKMALLVSQSQAKESESHPQTSRAQCPQEYLSPDHKSQDKVSVEQDGVVIIGEKNHIGNKVPGTPENVTGQSEKQMEQNESWSDVSLASDTETEALPLIVATHSLSQEQDAGKESTEKGEITALVSTEMEATKKKVVMPLESEPLKPVTIGSSLQPLEEIQEASSVMEDSSFSADVAIIDSSADEADSIGGLVINNVIGAADGVVDFQPDEVETEKELTDISASAPQLGESNDSSDELGPSAKRRRLENGPNGVEDKSNSAKKVILKVIPVKNGHGVWDSQKLQEVLLTKGTILLQIHASKESMELFALDKDDRKIDFTAIMAETKDVDHDHMLSFANVEPEGDDPLAVAASHPDTSSLPSFGRPFPHPHPRSRSTALQPAMSRPGFKHLQTPQLYHMKNQVLGLPPPPCLEFEEPQMGAPDWSGMDTRTVVFPETQVSPQSSEDECLMPHRPGPKSKRSREKVCPECGKVFHHTQRYKLHVSSHKPLLDCGMCSFKTKEPMELNMHKFTHKKENPRNECYICHKFFVSKATLRNHRKRIHSAYICRFCDVKYNTEKELVNHMQEQHGHTRKGQGSVEPSDSKHKKLSAADKVPDVDKSQLTCQFCKNVSRNKDELKLHLAQHLGTASKEISDGLLNKHDCKVMLETQVSSEATSFKADVKCEVIVDEAVDTVCNTCEQPSPTLGQTLFICNPVGQPLSVMRSSTTLQSPTTNTIEMMRPEVIPTVYNTPLNQLSTVPSIPSGQPLLICNPVGQPLHVPRPHIILPSPALTTPNELTLSPYTQATPTVCVPSVQPPMCVPSDQPSTSQYGATPEATPSTSFSSISQTSATKVWIPTQEEAEMLPEYSLFRCFYCDVGFPTPSDLNKHSLEAHPTLALGKVLLPTMRKKTIYEEAKESVSKKLKVKMELPCNECEEVFTCKTTLRIHKKTHRKFFTCLHCNSVFRSPFRLMRHQKSAHKNKYRCRYGCGVLVDSYAELLNHYEREHDKNLAKIECPHCPKRFVYRASLMNHLEKCKRCPPDRRPTHVCGNCEGFFPNVEMYNDHAKICFTSLKKKEQRKMKVSKKVASKTVESTPQNLVESATNIFKNCVNISADDSDTCDGSEGSVEDPNINSPYEFRRKRSTTGYVKCTFCPTLVLENDRFKLVTHIFSHHKTLVARMTTSPHKCKICGVILKSNDFLCRHLLSHYLKKNMWDVLLPQDILKLVTVKNYCWICKSTYKCLESNRHGIMRNMGIDKAFKTEGFRKVVESLKCEICNKTFSTLNEFWVHVKNYISTLPVEVSPDKLSQNSIDPGLLECTVCRFKCRKMGALHDHVVNHFIKEKT